MAWEIALRHGKQRLLNLPGTIGFKKMDNKKELKKYLSPDKGGSFLCFEKTLQLRCKS